jgi:zinc transporter
MTIPKDHASFAFHFDGTGQAYALDIAESQSIPKQGFVWTHLIKDDARSAGWLGTTKLPPIIVSALTAEETRPRCTPHGDGAVVILHGVNLNDGARAEDMISIRLWITRNSIISYAVRPLQALTDMKSATQTASCAKTTGELVSRLTRRLVDRAEPTVAELNEQLDTVEETLLTEGTLPDRATLSEIRRAAITLRRYMLPQRDALTTLLIEDFSWLSNTDLTYLREATDRITLLAEELDTIRDRAQVVQDQILDKRSEVMNRQLFILSAVAAIFLPLGLITGLLGINVGGIPGVENPNAFWIVCAGLVALTGGVIWLFRKWGLL